MPETLSNHENEQKKETWHISPEKHRALPTEEQATPDTHEADPRLRAEQARQSVEQTASDHNPIERLEAAEKAAKPVAPSTVNRELKAITLRRELKTLQRKESLPQRTLSHVIHQPVIRAVSEAASKTISRPSGQLGGGLVALLGSSGYLYLTKHDGATYNYLFFLLLFIGGFFVGLALELLVHIATASRRGE